MERLPMSPDGRPLAALSSEANDVILEQAAQKRKMCKKCLKAAPLCICSAIQVAIRNRTRVSILQHPEEKNHHLGSVRVAMLGLSNVEVISVPEILRSTSYRFRPKVPGSNRSGEGKTGIINHHTDGQLRNHDCYFCGCVTMDPQLSRTAPSWINLSPNAAVLFPIDKAQDIHALYPDIRYGFRAGVDGKNSSENGIVGGALTPDQLIVLDGTWSKAKRIYMENPWLQELPHYKLPSTFRSMYEHVRSEPRAGCLSTLESIVYALKAFEPETEGVESLLDIFEDMIINQQKYMIEKKKKHHS